MTFGFFLSSNEFSSHFPSETSRAQIALMSQESEESSSTSFEDDESTEDSDETSTDGGESRTVLAQLCQPASATVKTYNFGDTVEFCAGQVKAPAMEVRRTLPVEKKKPVRANGLVKAEKMEKKRNALVMNEQSIYACVAKQCCNENCIYNYGASSSEVCASCLPSSSFLFSCP